MTYPVVGQESSHGLVLEPASQEGTTQCPSLGIPGIFGGTEVSVFDNDTANNAWQYSTHPLLDDPGVGGRTATNLDWFSDILDSQYVESPSVLSGMPEYQTFTTIPLLPILGESGIHSSMDNKFALEIGPQLVDEL